MGESFRSYRDLQVWEGGMRLAEACYLTTKAFPREEIYGITSQIRRSAASVPANVAEGYGRNSPKEFVRFLRIVQGSLKELETHLILASNVGLVTMEDSDRILRLCATVAKMLGALIRTV